MSDIVIPTLSVPELAPALSRHRDRAGITRVEKRCPLCLRSRYRGRLWMGGGDYIRCPDCDGTGTFVSYAQPIGPPGARIFMPGETYPGTIIPVELESA